VICGFGRVGYEVAEEFNARSLPFVVVDNDPTALQWAQHRGYLVVNGDATQDETLEAAGVGRARCLVAASGGDVQNTYILASARTRHSDGMQCAWILARRPACPQVCLGLLIGSLAARVQAPVAGRPAGAPDSAHALSP